MSDSVQGVECEWEGHGSLNTKLDGKWQAGKCRDKCGSLEWEAKHSRKGVGASQGVESTRHGHTGDSVQTWQVPCELGLVNLQVWRDGTVLSLLNKKFLLLFVAHLHGLCGSKSHISEQSRRNDRGSSDRSSCKGWTLVWAWKAAIGMNISRIALLVVELRASNIEIRIFDRDDKQYL